MKTNNINCIIKFITNEITEETDEIPDYKIDYTGVAITLTGVDAKFSASVGRSKIKRAFTSKKHKDKIPAPYFVKFNPDPGDAVADTLIGMIVKNNISKFKVGKGILTCEVYSEQVDVSAIVRDIEEVMKTWG